MLVDAVDEWLSYLPTGAAPQIRGGLGLGYAQIGLLLALLPAGGIVGNARLVAADFVSRRALASLGALVYASCLATFAVGHSFGTLAAASFVWGAASDAFVHGSSLALAELAGDDLDATLAGKDLFGSIGTLAAPATVAAAAVLGLGWRPVFACGAVVTAGFGAWLACQPLPAPVRAEPTPWRAVRATLADRRVLRLGVVGLLWDTLDAPFLGLATVYLVSRGYSASGAALTVGTWTAGALVAYALMTVRPPDGVRTMRRAAVLRAPAVGALVAVPVPVVAATASFVLGVSAARFWVPYQGEVLRARPGQRGTTWAVISAVALPGLAPGPAVGALADRVGLTAAMSLFAASPLVVVAVLGAAGTERPS